MTSDPNIISKEDHPHLETVDPEDPALTEEEMPNTKDVAQAELNEPDANLAVDAKAKHMADRAPTQIEESAAQYAEHRLREDGEMEQVAEHYKDAIERGAEVKGEGEIE